MVMAIPLIYINRNSYISEYSWKSVSQNKIIDWMEFNDGYLTLDGRTVRLVESNKKEGTILFCFHKYLIAKNNKGELCFYTNKGK